MDPSKDYIAINRASWNNRTDAHIHSEFYDMPSFLAGKSSLKEIELPLLGNLHGKSVLHLQCHFGQDSISLSRLGAKVTGVDLSDKAIDKAREIATETGSDVQFICCDIFDLRNHLECQFDVVFASYGTIGWLPDLNKWASIVEHYLKPGGKFVFVEFHPVIWMFDEQFQGIQYSYFNTGAIAESETGTYADKEADISQDYVMWNHSLSEVMGSILRNGLQIEHFDEFDYSPYDCFNNTTEFQSGKFRIINFDANIPMVYALVASKTA